MNRKEIRELSEINLGVHGSGKSRRINKAILNQLTNQIQLEYFKRTRTLKAYMHATITKGQFEYKLPSDCLRLDRINVENAKYAKRVFPAVVDSYEIAFSADQVVDA